MGNSNLHKLYRWNTSTLSHICRSGPGKGIGFCVYRCHHSCPTPGSNPPTHHPRCCYPHPITHLPPPHSVIVLLGAGLIFYAECICQCKQAGTTLCNVHTTSIQSQNALWHFCNGMHWYNTCCNPAYCSGLCQGWA